MALIKHPACKLSAVRFLNDPQEVDQHHFVTGSWEQTANSLHLWSASRQSGVALLHQQDHETGDVCAIQSLKSSLIATASSQGSISVYYADGQELKQVSERRVSSGVLTSLAFVDRLNAVLCAGEDGALSLLFIDKLSGPLQRQQVCQSPITCVDALPGSEVLCGNTAGCVKSVDSRSLTVTASLCHSLCPVTSVRRNPSNPHLIASGTQAGNLCLWDLRKTDAALLQLAAHSACITELQYKENETNVIVSSSLDGKLIKWNLLPTCEVTAAEAIVSPQSLAGPAIICFNLHKQANELVYATDKEILSLISM